MKISLNLSTALGAAAALCFFAACSKSETPLSNGGDSPKAETTPDATESEPVSKTAAAPTFWTDVTLHRAIRAGNVGYSGNGQFQINEQGQPEAIVLANCGVTNIDVLADMPLLMLDMQGCPISNIDAIKGMPLVELYLDKTNVEDLSALEGNTTLKKLYLNETNVEDLAPLKGLPLEELNLVGARADDITPLAGMPLRMLWLTGLPISDTSPLATTPLVSLTLHRTQVADLRPLSTMRTLQRLHVGDTPVKDLTPIARLPLTRLVFTPSTVEKGVDEVRKIPTMQQLGVEFEDDMSTLMPPPVFWAKFDAGEFK
ncbi:MAG: hypothetical protein KDN19_02940 [Verrucomicrobiae bacterium]|nr:hypothetical protein [Verrucomicrobiae bacterium]